MKKIALTQGQFAVVDDEDYEWLNQWKWTALYSKGTDNYYAYRQEHIQLKNGNKKLKTVYMHRIILNYEGRQCIDHINNDSLDNRKSNLRIVSQRQNTQNKKLKKTSKYPGVCWHKGAKKWHAQIWISKKRLSLGYFSNERDAAKAYEDAVRNNCFEELVCKTKVEAK